LSGYKVVVKNKEDFGVIKSRELVYQRYWIDFWTGESKPVWQKSKKPIRYSSHVKAVQLYHLGQVQRCCRERDTRNSCLSGANGEFTFKMR
jgi:hypothetical protein